MHRVVVLLLPPVVGFDAAIAPTLFSNATDADGNPLYDVVTCGLTADPVAATTGFDLLPSAGPEALATADTVVIPGTRFPVGTVDGVLPTEATAALALIRPGTWLVSICTGAFVLAAAGSARRTARDHPLEVRRRHAPAAPRRAARRERAVRR